MKILVTGGSGKIGDAVVARLVRHGHSVRVADLRPAGRPVAGADYGLCDVTSFDGLRAAVDGVEGIVHLAAYPHPGAAAGPEIFRVNCWGTFQLFEAAAAAGVRRIVCASSINALGFSFGVRSFPIEYFPVDEDHPTLTTDPYSFSKATIESIAAYYWRRDRISSICLRLPGVLSADGPDGPGYGEWIKAVRSYVQEVLSLPEESRQPLLSALAGLIARNRESRFHEKVQGESGYQPSKLLAAAIAYDILWAMIDSEDAAQAFEKSLLAEFDGSHPLCVTQRENMAGFDSEALLKVFFPEVAARRQPLSGAATLVSYQRAARLIGFSPEFDVRRRLGLAD